MKFAVFALISMYVIVQTCGNVIINHPTSGKLYKTTLNSRRVLVPQVSSSASAHYSNKNKAYKHNHNFVQIISTTDGRKMIIPVSASIVPVAVGGVSSYNSAAHSASAHKKQHSYNFQFQSARRNDEAATVVEPVEEVEEVEVVNSVPAAPTCDNKIDVSNEISEEVEVKTESEADKYHKEMCHHFGTKINSLMEEMTSEDAEDDMSKMFITGHCQYTDSNGVFHDETYTADENGFKIEENVSSSNPPTHHISAETFGL